MELTREEAIRLHRELWKWLAENPMKKKADWPGWEKIEPVRHLCPCCEYAKYDWNIQTCEKKCPLEWKRLRSLSDTPCLCSYFKDWERATAPEERSKYAALIRDLPEKAEKKEPPKPEPKFKPGDKVVPVRKSVWYIDDSEPNCASWKNGKFQKEYLTVTGIVSDKINYLRGNINGGQIYRCDGDYYLESDLIPYVEPKPEPKFNIGDRVRCIKAFMSNTVLNKIGTILDIDKEHFAIEFDEHINGHDGFADGRKGKHGYCWCMPLGCFKPLTTINHCPEPKTITESGATFIFRDSVTVCIIGADGRKFKGIARCAPEVTWDETIGKGWAYIRAMRKILNAIEKNLKKA